MIKRPLGKTGLSVSAIGFGAWNIGGQWGKVTREEAIATIRAAHDAGVNFFDTADAYGDPPGLSEELIGEALAPVRDRAIIATKVGNFARRLGHPIPFTHPLHVELCCDASLNRLRTDSIDVYQCHLANLTEPQIFLDAFETLRRKGKIRFAGSSTEKTEVLKAFNIDGNCAVVQLEYSLVHRDHEDGLLPFAQQHGIGVIARGPLAQGVCSGKYSAESRFTDSVRSSWNDGARRELFLAQLKQIERVRFLDSPARPLAMAALQYVIAHPAVSTAIVGARTPEQARENALAGTHEMSDDERDRVRSLLAST
jgi:aryl-alcohol dehydrogenase-like predicted oxidoreductase